MIHYDCSDGDESKSDKVLNWFVLTSPPDHRNICFEDVISFRNDNNGCHTKKKMNLPNHLDYSQELREIFRRTQSTTGGNGTKDNDDDPIGLCLVMEWLLKKATNKYIDLYPRFVYNRRDTTISNGVYIQDILSIVKHQGIPSKKEYNRDRSKIVEMASCRKIHGYAQVKTINGLKSALHQYGPCFMTMPSYNNNTNNFWTSSNIKEVMCAKKRFVLVVGYTQDDDFILCDLSKKICDKRRTVLWKYSDFGVQDEIWCILDRKRMMQPVAIDALKRDKICEKLKKQYLVHQTERYQSCNAPCLPVLLPLSCDDHARDHEHIHTHTRPHKHRRFSISTVATVTMTLVSSFLKAFCADTNQSHLHDSNSNDNNNDNKQKNQNKSENGDNTDQDHNDEHDHDHDDVDISNNNDRNIPRRVVMQGIQDVLLGKDIKQVSNQVVMDLAGQAGDVLTLCAKTYLSGHTS